MLTCHHPLFSYFSLLMTNPEKYFAYLVLVTASMLGSLSLLLFGMFLFGYSFSFTELGFGRAGVLLWDACLCLLFFFQHSAMIRRSFRQRIEAFVPEYFQGALYTASSGVVLIVLVLFWQNSEQVIVSLQGTSRWMASGVFFASLAGMMWGMYALHSFDVFGNQKILAHIRAAHVRDMPLAIQGPYRWVRHPLYFFTLLAIWSCPDLTVDRLLFNVLFTIWIVIGTLLEERDLVAEFRETYLDYQRRVPMLIPWKPHKPYSQSMKGIVDK